MWSTGSLLYKLHKFEDLINWIIIGLQWIGWMKCLELTFAVICSYIDKSELNWGIFIQLSGFVFKPKEQILQIIWFNSWIFGYVEIPSLFLLLFFRTKGTIILIVLTLLYFLRLFWLLELSPRRMQQWWFITQYHFHSVVHCLGLPLFSFHCNFDLFPLGVSDGSQLASFTAILFCLYLLQILNNDWDQPTSYVRFQVGLPVEGVLQSFPLFPLTALLFPPYIHNHHPGATAG